MPKYLIERAIPNVGTMSREEMRNAAQKSCSTLQGIGPQIQWIQSYVTDDELHCVYIAPDEATVQEHALRSGFPATRIVEIRSIIDPTTAEAREGAGV